MKTAGLSRFCTYFIYYILLNRLITSFLSRDKITSYKPGPNLEPTNPIRNGWPTPLKLVLCFSINYLINGSKVSLLKEEIFSKSNIKSFIINLD